MDFGDFRARPLSATTEATYDSAGGPMAEKSDAGPKQETLATLESIETRCLELSTLARRSGLRHIEYLLQIAAQEAAARRAPPVQARPIAARGTETDPRLRTAAEIIA